MKVILEYDLRPNKHFFIMDNSKKSVAIIGTVGVPAKYGGFETLAHYLVRHLASKMNITVYNSTHHYSAKERVSSWEGASIVYVPLKPNGIQSIFYDFFSMLHAMFFADVLLVLGVSGCLFLPILKMVSDKKIIVNVDGMEWKRSKWGRFTKLFLRYSESIAIRYADEVICDNAVIKNYVKQKHKVESALIAYGADHTRPLPITEDMVEKYAFLDGDYAFKVCRIEPENNIHMVLGAFAKLPAKQLVIVGNWAHSKYGLKLKERYGGYENITLLDPIYNLAILDVLRSNCSFYLHGHSAGGTNPSLVEAMHLGLPVLTFDVDYNRATTYDKSIYFKSESELIDAIENTSTAQLRDLATQLKQIADQQYTWSTITHRYFSLIEGGATEQEVLMTADIERAA